MQSNCPRQWICPAAEASLPGMYAGDHGQSLLRKNFACQTVRCFRRDVDSFQLAVGTYGRDHPLDFGDNGLSSPGHISGHADRKNRLLGEQRREGFL
jgi:hypothetical protein